MSIDANTIESAAAIVTAVGGVYTAVKHIWAHSKRKREAYRQSILDEAKAEGEKIRADLENRIRGLEAELQLQKENVAKDMGHLREVYNAEIKVLGEKIEDLRQDLGAQHAQMVGLLTRLVNSK